VRDLHAVQMRMLGAEHPSTLTSAGNLAAALARRGKYTEAEAIEREMLGVLKRVLGAEHPDTLSSAANLAGALSRHSEYAHAEAIECEVLGVESMSSGQSIRTG
jgi:hypothetical protein